jgi:caspase domain-containing protein/CHAT domain-containing protein
VSESYAILIGNSIFPSEAKLPPLRYPENDVDALYELLTSPEHGVFAPERTFVLKNRTSQEVRERTNEVLSQAERDDLVLVYYAGHGKLNRRGKLHLATVDTRLSSLESTSFSVSGLREFIEISRSKRIVVILDCRFSGYAGDIFAHGTPEDSLQQFASGHGIQVMTASTGVEVAEERESDRHGAFTKHLLAGMRGGADLDGDGLVGVDELYRYVHQNVVADGSQQPTMLNLDKADELYIAKTSRKPREERNRQIVAELFRLAGERTVSNRLVTQAMAALEVPADQRSPSQKEQVELLDRWVERRVGLGELTESWARLTAGAVNPSPDSVPAPPKDPVEDEEGLERHPAFPPPAARPAPADRTAASMPMPAARRRTAAQGAAERVRAVWYGLRRRATSRARREPPISESRPVRPPPSPANREAPRSAAGRLRAVWEAISRRSATARDSTIAVKPGRSEPPGRYANASLLEEIAERLLPTSVPIPSGLVLRLRLDIGAPSPESQVMGPVEFPEYALPDADIWLDVTLSSTDFAVGESRGHLGQSRVVDGGFFLRRGGGPARTSKGGRYLYFFLRAPSEPARGARARATYYFRGAVVQSQVLIADVGTGQGGFEIVTDYTIAQSPDGLLAIADRPRFTVIANDSGATHHVSIRAAVSAGDIVPATTLEVDKRALGSLIGDLRRALRRDEIAPTTRRRSKDQLIGDLRALAPVGWRLWSALASQVTPAWDAVRQQPESLVIHVARTDSSSFAFPWSFVYEHFLDSDLLPEKLEVCPLLADWDERQPLLEGSPRDCPHAARVSHENLLCPLGFWGFRYSVEQLSSTDQPVTRIELLSDARAVIAETQYGVERERLARHVQEMRAVLPGLTVFEGNSKKAIRALLGADLPLVYFFCHGEKLNAASSDTYLGIGRNEKITADDFNGWVKSWREGGQQVWDRVRPLIFINACHSVEINPDTLVSYLGAFVRTARAAGVIGTEVKVHQELAMQLAVEFFAHFVRDGWSVERALREVRLDFLRDGNLFGLLYTPYCWADLTLSRPSAAAA